MTDIKRHVAISSAIDLDVSADDLYNALSTKDMSKYQLHETSRDIAAEIIRQEEAKVRESLELKLGYIPSAEELVDRVKKVCWPNGNTNYVLDGEVFLVAKNKPLYNSGTSCYSYSTEVEYEVVT